METVGVICMIRRGVHESMCFTTFAARIQMGFPLKLYLLLPNVLHSADFLSYGVSHFQTVFWNIVQ